MEYCFWVYDNEIPIYPIFYLLRGTISPAPATKCSNSFLCEARAGGLNPELSRPCSFIVIHQTFLKVHSNTGEYLCVGVRVLRVGLPLPVQELCSWFGLVEIHHGMACSYRGVTGSVV